MPTLDWIGKKKVVNHHLDVPFKVLNKQYTFSADGKAKNSENKIIHGDNLEALKALLPEYEGKIKCIYIDPPYNTGKEKWVYNDNVNDPRIKKWLGEVVGQEGEDLTRHDKWLCMMYPRLKLLQKLLSEDGAIFISIDDNEHTNLKLICDEIFGSENFIGNLSVENNPKGRKNSNFISVSSEYLLIYAKEKENLYFEENIPKKRKDLVIDEETGRYVHNSGKRVLVGENDFNEIITDFSTDKHYSVYYNKETQSLKIKKENKIDAINQDLINKGFERFISFYEDNFVENTYTSKKLLELFNNKALVFKNQKIYEKNFNTSIRIKSIVSNREYLAVVNDREVNYKLDVKTTSAGQELKDIFGTVKIPFENPKNVGLINLILTLFNDKNMVVLDSFAGSGTTAHALLNLNKLDRGNRKFILIELNDYAESITAERVKRVIKGYGKEKNKVEGLGGDFNFYELGEPLLVDGLLNEKVDVSNIREYIWFTETHSKLLTNLQTTDNEYFLGKNNDAGYWFYYKKNEETCLNYEFLSTMKTKADQYIIYADVCRLPDSFLKEHNIVFKKIPREIQKF